MPEHLPWSVRLTALEVRELENLLQWAIDRMHEVEDDPWADFEQRRGFADHIRSLEQHWMCVRFVQHWADDRGMPLRDAFLVVELAARGNEFHCFIGMDSRDPEGVYVELCKAAAA